MLIGSLAACVGGVRRSARGVFGELSVCGCRMPSTGAAKDAMESRRAQYRTCAEPGCAATTAGSIRCRSTVKRWIGSRCGIGDPQVAQRQVVVLGPALGDEATLSTWAVPGGVGGVEVQAVPLHGDLFDTLAMLSALVAERALPAAPQALHALAARLRSARYAVLVGAPARLPAQGALIVEAVHQVVGSLNRSTRAAALWIGGGNGAATVNQVFTWLSGLPLRSRAGPSGLEHEPVLFDTTRLLADGAVDALLWVASFDAQAAPPPNRVPTVLLGHPALAAASLRSGVPTVFIPVATPGIGSAGHLFRTDGTVLMPLDAVYRDRLPSVADVVGQIMSALRAVREGALA